MERVKAAMVAGAAPHPAYCLGPTDVYDLEPIGATIATFAQLATTPTALQFEHLALGGRLVHYGFFSFVCLGNSLSSTRDDPMHAARRVLRQISVYAEQENLSRLLNLGDIAEASCIASWLAMTAPTSGAILCQYSSTPASREQNVRDRHVLRYGSTNQNSAPSARRYVVEHG